MLAERDPSIDVPTLFAFAQLHDCQRTTNTYDQLHGPRAARAIAASLVPNDRLERLLYAVEHHTDGATTDDPTIGACWDADRLNLWRVGIAPDIAYMSTATAKKNFDELSSSARTTIASSPTWRGVEEALGKLLERRDLEVIKDTLVAGAYSEAATHALRQRLSGSLPDILYRLWHEGRIEDIGRAVGDAWVLHRSPASAMDAARWIEMFRAAGLVTRSKRASQAAFAHVLTLPTEPFTLWRGAPKGAARGMSWSFYEDCARNFASVWAERTGGPAGTYRTVADPGAVLALFGDKREQEVVVDPSLLGKVQRAGLSMPTSALA